MKTNNLKNKVKMVLKGILPKRKSERITPVLMADFYKLSHPPLYPQNTQEIYSTLTPRYGKYAPYTDKVAVFLIQLFVKKICMEIFQKDFFDLPKDVVVEEYRRVVKYTLGQEVVDTSHVEALHDLGYLPIEIKALPEGTLVPFGTPILTIRNTVPEFFWITNFLETILSTTVWQGMTSATLSMTYRKILNKYALKTTGTIDGVEFQGHDFSMRGMSSLESAMYSAAGHLLSFVGTDTIPGIQFLEMYYNADVEKEMVGTSIPATEHSVMSAGTSPEGERDEYDTFKRIITKVFPNGFVSIVSDTYDFWKVVTETLPRLKEEIMNRDGRVVVRPDSGDPVDILTGTVREFGKGTTPEEKGLIECLWETFGGTITKQGYKVLDTHIGAIYGDSITLERCEQICERLEAKGFASTNVVYGIGSYTFQYNTRDTLGFAMKATAGIFDGEHRMLFKDPKTDSKKRSQKGRVYVYKDENDEIAWKDGYLREEDIPSDSLLETVFLDGALMRDENLSDIRERLVSQI